MIKNPKKIHEDEEFAVFKGHGGHELKVLKKGLSKKLREELASLPLHSAKGGKISEPEEFEPGKDYSNAPLPGDKPEEAPASQSESAPPKKSEGIAHSLGKMIKEHGIDPVMQGVKDFAGAAGKAAEIGKEVGQGAGLIPEEAPAPQVPAVAPQATAPEVAAPAPEPQQQPEQPAPQPQQQAPSQVTQRTPQEVVQAYKGERDEEAAKLFQDTLQGHIQPKTYEQLFEDKSTLGKIGSLFGLLVSGAGSGLAHQPNMVMEMMNKEIERDLEAQKKSAENAQNLYQLNIQKELNAANITRAEAETKGIWKDVERKALENSKTQMELFAMHSLMSKANLLPPGKEKMAADQTVSGIQSTVAQGIDHRNQRAAEQDALRALGYMGLVKGADRIAEARDERYVPGAGEAGIPVPANVRGELGAHQKLNDAVGDLMQYSKSHSNIVPGTPEYNAGVAKAMAVQQMVREGLLGTVFRESEKPLLNKFVNENPAGAFKAFTTQPKLKSILESNRISSNALKKQYDLPTEKSGPVDGATGVEKSTGRETVFKGGKWVYKTGKK